MDQEQKDQLISEFQSISQAKSSETAVFFLEGSNWDLSAALAQYFEQSDQAQIDQITPPTSEPQISRQPPIMNPHSDTPSVNQPSQSSNTPARRLGVRRGPVTLNDMKSSDEDEDDSQNYYTGGEKSGMMVQDPQPKKKDKDSVISGIFQAARESGAEAADERNFDEELRRNPFSGSGYRLGDTEGPSYVVKNNNSNSQEKELFKVKLVLWSNGFTINDGELHKFDDPSTPAFFQKLYNREIPPEIQSLAPGREISLAMVDHRHQEYTPPKQKVQAFAGTGHVLGGETTTTSTSTTPSTPPPASNTSPSSFFLDETKPITSVQIRLHDGTRMISRFNHHHTIQDIRNFINRSRPGQNPNFFLRSGFPVKILGEDQNQTTLDEAGLLNSVVVQSYS